MTEAQAFNEIVSELKWYIGYCSQGYASTFVKRYHAGELKQKTIDEFLMDFGYEIEQKTTWKKGTQQEQQHSSTEKV